MTAKQPKSPHFNIVQKIWREVKRPFKKVGRKMRQSFRGLQGKLFALLPISPETDELPAFISVEASTLCQLKCLHCNIRNDFGIIGKGFLKYIDFKKFLDNHEFIKRIELSSYGEIFLNPELSEIIKYAHSKKVELTANSGVNFNTVKDEMLELLVKCKFNSLCIAVDGASQEIYSQYRVNGNFDTVISNIKKLNKYKMKYNSEFPKLRWQYVIMSHNECEVAKAKILAKALDMEIFFKLTWDPGYVPTNVEMLRKETGLKHFTRDDYEKDFDTAYIVPCHQLFTRPQINWDGRLLGCCCQRKDDFGVNVFEVGLKKALNSKQYTYAKKMLRGKVTQPKFRIASNPCSKCSIAKRILANDNYLSLPGAVKRENIAKRFIGALKRFFAKKSQT